MRNGWIAATVTLAGLTSLPALAGPNWDVIHMAEAGRASHKHEAKLVLPLDHGPRPLTTPWENAERLRRMQELSAQAQKEKSAVLASHAHHVPTHS